MTGHLRDIYVNHLILHIASGIYGIVVRSAITYIKLAEFSFDDTIKGIEGRDSL